MRGARHAYAASTLWAVIIGNRSPNTTMTGLSIPVSSLGSTTWSGTSTRAPVTSLYQWFRHRLRASGPCGSASPTRAASITVGPASSANVGNEIPRSANRATLLAKASSSTTRSASPNWPSNWLANWLAKWLANVLANLVEGSAGAARLEEVTVDIVSDNW